MRWISEDAKIVRLCARVRVPAQKPVLLIKATTNNAWEDYFIKRRDSAKDNVAMRQYDCCRAVVKWAEACNGEIVSCHNAKDDIGNPAMEFEIMFPNIDCLRYFYDDFEECVTGAVM